MNSSWPASYLGSHVSHNHTCIAGEYPKVGEGGPDALLSNSSFAEQQNSPLASLKSGAVHMQQATLLWVVRNFLYKKSRRQSLHYLRRDKGASVLRANTPTGAVTASATSSDVAAQVVQQ
jgi:hypothetical protein